MLSVHPLGRELSWDYYRINNQLLLDTYSEDDARIGKILIDITRTFETDYLFLDLLQFVFSTTTGSTANARFVALEYVSTNIIWLADKEEEIAIAFNLRTQPTKIKTNMLTIDKSTENVEAFKNKAREEFMRLLKETEAQSFPQLKHLL